MRAKEFLRGRGAPFVERDVARDQTAAAEMIRRSGQMGVPVITTDDEVIVGFDQARLERLARRYARPAGGAERPRLGLMVKDGADGAVAVGGVRPGSPAERAGLQAGDVVVSVNGQAVASVADLERLAGRSGPLELMVRRMGVHLRVPVSR